MGKRFKVTLALAGCIAVLYSAIGPLLVLLLKNEERNFLLVLWIAIFGIMILAVVCSVVVYFERHAMQMIKATRRDITSKSNHDVIAEVRDARLKQSKHEFKQELLLDRIDANTSTIIGDLDSFRAHEVVPSLAPIRWHGGNADGCKVLFITSNGSGMGHLSRCLAVASEAESAGIQTAILTLSTAYQVVSDSGYPVMYHPSSAASPWSISVWNRSFSRFLHQFLKVDRPHIVVFDGTAVYRGVTQVCRRLEIPLVWLRRGMWKDEAPRVQYDHPFGVADFVVVPGEVTGHAPHDRAEVNYVGPISQANQYTILDPADARLALGLDPERRYALIQVGTAQIEERSVVSMTVDLLKESRPGLTPVILVSPVAQYQPDISGCVILHGQYPLAPYLKAFDLAVSSAGYNSVHENLAVGLPAVYVPNTSAVTDDQTARAKLVEQAGMGYLARDEPELKEALRNLVDSRCREDVSGALTTNVPMDGAKSLVALLRKIIATTDIDTLHSGTPTIVADEETDAGLGEI